MTVQQLPQDLERLASRLALIVAGDAEAEAAARAAGQLARRLGLSGGQIKAIFLAGVRAISGQPGTAVALTLVDRNVGQAVELAGRTEREAGDLRRLLDQTDDELQTARRHAEQLQEENEVLRDALDRARNMARFARLAGALLLAAVLAAGLVAWYGLGLRVQQQGAMSDGQGMVRMAVVGHAGVSLYAEPDRGTEQVARLPAGTRLPVRQLLWRGLAQWVETEAAGRVGYAPATDVDLN